MTKKYDAVIIGGGPSGSTAATDLALAGHNVALISSGDAGIYGMAGLVLELVTQQKLELEVRLVAGITASIAAALLLGAPLMHDFCHISLSDLMTPWAVIGGYGTRDQIGANVAASTRLVFNRDGDPQVLA